jgi:phosphonate ABC transporter substrate-binding protein
VTGSGLTRRPRRHEGVGLIGATLRLCLRVMPHPTTLRAFVSFVLIFLCSAARAETVTVGLFAPTAPFPSTAARVELASKLGDVIGAALGGKATGKVFARAGDFASAVKKGDVQIALVDAAYLANAGGGYTVLAAAVRGGDTQHRWQLVARGAEKFGDLKGKRVLVPAIGGRETDFVLDVLLGGEVGKDYFGAIESAPDTASALAALGLGKADAAVVPAGVELPSSVVTVLALPAVSGPVLVAYGLTAAQRTAVASAVVSFQGDATVAGFKAASADQVQAVARRFTVPVKRGPLAVPAVRLLVGDLVEGRTFSIERTPVTAFAVAPAIDHH